MPAEAKITVALAGNPNSGKSTIFNQLTGSNQNVGNYPGVTVEKREGGVSHRGYEITVVDLPGTYSLSAASEDEKVARDFILREKPDVVVHIVDTSNLERNLYLYVQLQELEVPVVLALNMSDLAEKKGLKIDPGTVSRLIGKPVVPMVGNKNIGTRELLDAVVDLREGKIRSEKISVDYGEDIARELEKLKTLLGKDPELAGAYSRSWLAVKLLENDPWAAALVGGSAAGREVVPQSHKSRDHLKKHFADDLEVIIAEKRYGFVSGVCAEAVRRTAEERRDLSDKIDRIVLDRFLGLPIFAGVMYAIFKFTFSFSEPVVGWFGSAFEAVAALASGFIPQGLTRSLVVDGLIGGVGGVLGFFPLILFMFFAIAFFEDSGYMARAAFVMDRIMNRFGLPGKSFLPMMISTNGCAVLGILASRTLESKKDRLITMMVTPFMICGAKLPIFALFIGAFFPADMGANLMFAMYALSVVLALGSAWLLRRLVFREGTSHFVMELPPYRMPSLKGLLLKMWERGWLYVRKAGTVILFISILLWAGFAFPAAGAKDGAGQGETVPTARQIEQSYVGRLGKWIEPAVRPLGMDWRAGVALISGIAAKEVVVSTFGTLYSFGGEDAGTAGPLKEALQKDPAWSPLKALAFLMFCLIYMPCVTAMVVFHKESGSGLRWTLFLIFWTTAMAWVGAFIVYQGGLFLGWGG